jgi:hypothetical protein
MLEEITLNFNMNYKFQSLKMILMNNGLDSCVDVMIC